MNPDYISFIRYHDKRLIPIIYGVLLMLLGFYWRNNGYSLTIQDVWFISGIVAIVFFNFICDLRAYWMYKYQLNGVELDFFDGQRCSRLEKIVSYPLTGGVISFFVTWAFIQAGVLFSEKPGNLVGLIFILPLFLYIIYRQCRTCCIKRVIMEKNSDAHYKKPYQTTICYFLLSLALNLLTISPLKRNPDFSLNEGWFSPKLIIAMFILCVIVLFINLIFSSRSRRYILLGEIFLKELEFTTPPAIPCASLQAKPVILRMLFLLIVQFAWILSLNLTLTLLGWSLPFEIYYLFCCLPATGYYFLHLYWLWQSDYLTACDMYLRCIEISKRTGFW